MIIRNAFFLSLLKRIRFFNFFLFLLASLTLLAVMLRISFDEVVDAQSKTPQISQVIAKERSGEEKHALEPKILRLSKLSPTFPVYNLKEKFRLVSCDSRPDQHLGERKFHLQLLSSGAMIDVSQGDRVYLEFDGNHHLTVGNASSPLWMEAYQMDAGGALCKGGLLITRENGEPPLLEGWEFQLEVSSENGEGDLGALVKPLQKSKWWGADRLIDLYGGSRYEGRKGCQRIETGGDKGNSMVYVKQGEYLVLEGGNLVRKELGVETKQLPLFYLRSVSDDKLSWDVWDAKGVKQGSFEQRKERAPSFVFTPNTFFSQIRRRSRSVVTCRIENKMVVLKKGDWLLNTGSGWQALTSLEEVSALITFEVRGMLFVFDGVEPRNEGNIFHGTLFDPSRTQSFPVSLPLPKNISQEHSSHTKNTVSPTLPSSREEECEQPSSERRPKKAYLLEEEADPSSGY